MPIFKIVEYRLKQDKSSGYYFFKVLNPDGSIGDPCKGVWQPAALPIFASLVGILSTNTAYWDTTGNDPAFITGFKDGRAIDSKSEWEPSMNIATKKLSLMSISVKKKPSRKKK
jgi:hypothetical protein